MNRIQQTGVPANTLTIPLSERVCKAMGFPAGTAITVPESTAEGLKALDEPIRKRTKVKTADGKTEWVWKETGQTRRNLRICTTRKAAEKDDSGAPTGRTFFVHNAMPITVNGQPYNLELSLTPRVPQATLDLNDLPSMDALVEAHDSADVETAS